MLQSIQSFDMFSQPFQFQFKGRDVGKKTVIGTFSSVFVWILGLAYLVYLLIIWFSDSMNPTVIIQTNFISSLSYTFSISPILIKIITGEQDVEEGSYFSYEAFTVAATSKKFANTDIDMAACDDLSNQFQSSSEHSYMKEYQCVKPTDKDGNNIINLKVNQDGSANNLLIQQKACNPEDGGTNCATMGQIKDLMRDPFFKIEVLLVFYEFDFASSSLTQKFRKIVLPGDFTNVSSYTFYTEVSKIKEDRGWIWASVTEHQYISGYNVDLQVLDADFAFQKFSGVTDDLYFSSYAFELVLKEKETSVEHVKLSTILAMFSSIFNSLLLIGIIAQLNSKAQIYQDMSDVYLKEYYKITAEQLVQHELEESKRKMQESQRSLKKMKSNQEIIYEAAQKRRRELTTFFRVYIPDSWQEKKQKQNKVSDPDTIDPEKIYRISIDKAIENMTASKLFAEIYHLKTAIQLLFTEEQYAALFYVGRAIPQDYITRERNHLENNDYLEENINVREQYLQKFLENIENGKDKSYLSQMIQNSLLESVKKHEYQTGFFQAKGFGLGGRKTIFMSEKILEKEVKQSQQIDSKQSKDDDLINIQDDVDEEEDTQKQQEQSGQNTGIIGSVKRLAEQAQEKVVDKVNNVHDQYKQKPGQLPPLASPQNKTVNEIKNNDNLSQHNSSRHRVQKSNNQLQNDDVQSKASNMQLPKNNNTQEDELVIYNNKIPIETEQNLEKDE